MPTDEAFFAEVLDALSDIDGIESRKMMGEYMIYRLGKLTAYVCDDRLLVKPTASAKMMLPSAPMEPPYDGAKDMIRVDDLDRTFLKKLFDAMYEELPAPKKRC